MKKRVFTNRITACAAALLVSAAAAPTEGYAAQTAFSGAGTSLIVSYNKLPKDYASAMEFRNTYGAFYIDNSNYSIYLVFEEPVDTTETPRFQLQASEDLKEISHEIYRMPEDQTVEAHYQYEVVEYGLWPWRNGSVSLIDTMLPEEDQVVESYRFKSGSGGYIQSDDLYAWLPDSPTEFESFTQKRDILIHDNYIVFCMTDTAGTPYRWEESTGDKVNLENVKKVLSESFTWRQIPEPTGGPVFNIVVYEAVNDGAVQIDWEKRSFDPDEAPLEIRSGAFQIVNGAKQVLKPTDTWVELIDKGTAKRVDFHSYPLKSFSVSANTGMTDAESAEDSDDAVNPTAQVFPLLNNPCILSDFAPFFKDDAFTFELRTPPSYAVLTDETQVTHFENGSAAIRFSLTYQVCGDVNDDHILTPLDLHLMLRWLSGEKYLIINNWAATDTSGNGSLDAADVTMMKRELLKAQEQLPTCTLTVKTSYGGYGVAGQDLGSGSFENTYTVRSGDIFYEDFNGKLMQNAMLFQSEDEIPVLRIVEVTDQCVRVLGGFPDEQKVIEVPYDEPQEELAYSIHIVYDGINYSYELTFSDYTEPKQ